MARNNINETIKQAIQDVIAPQLQELKGEIAGLRGEIAGVRGEIAGLRGEMRQIEKRMEEGFIALRGEIGYTNKRIDEALDIRERLAALEAARPR
jgi:predicted  nucleic acid-binding Zn-ribbon protein